MFIVLMDVVNFNINPSFFFTFKYNKIFQRTAKVFKNKYVKYLKTGCVCVYLTN